MPPKRGASRSSSTAGTTATSASSGAAAAKELYYEEQRLGDAVTAASLRLQALQRVYLDRVCALATRRREQDALQQQLDVARCTLADKREEHMDVLTDYARQNKTEEQDTIARIVALDTALTQRHEERRRAQRQHQAQLAELEQAIKARQDEHEALRKRATDMEREFALMLADIEQSTHATGGDDAVAVATERGTVERPRDDSVDKRSAHSSTVAPVAVTGT